MLRTAIAAVVCAAITVPPMQTKQIVNTGPAPVGPYSSAIKAGGLIYLSGTLAQDDKGALVGDGDAAAQTRRVIDRMNGVLEASGSSLPHVVAVTVYLRSAADFPAPTTSSLMQLALGDALAVALLESRGVVPRRSIFVGSIRAAGSARN